MQRTLIVTANEDIAHLIKIFVSNRVGGTQICAEHPTQAMSILETERFDLMVCDLDLFSLDCKQLLITIQQNPQKMPVVIMIDTLHGLMPSSAIREHLTVVERFDFKKLSEVIEQLATNQMPEKNSD